MELNPAQRELLYGVPADGATIGNMRLRKKLGWSNDRYFAVRDSLVDAGLVELGRGRGGSVRRVATIPTHRSSSTGNSICTSRCGR